MNIKLKNSFLTLAIMMMALTVGAQDNAPVEMATGLYQSGKIYVVVIVIAIIFTGIAGYLVMLDRKITRLEKQSDIKK